MCSVKIFSDLSFILITLFGRHFSLSQYGIILLMEPPQKAVFLNLQPYAGNIKIKLPMSRARHPCYECCFNHKKWKKLVDKLFLIEY